MSNPTENQSGNPLELSDEEFMNLSFPPKVESTDDVVVDDADKTTVTTTTTDDPNKEVTTTVDNNKNIDNNDVVDTPETKSELSGKETTQVNDDPNKDKTTSAKPETTDKPNGESTVTEIDHKAFYEMVTKPIKANGKTIEIRTPEEAIKLMQMGANYTRKMQDIAPHRKVIMMLEDNGLLDTDKLSFLIDLEKKNPDAIKKLIKDSGMDPMGYDPDEQINYHKGHHAVSDEEAHFRTVLKDYESTSEGKETLQAIHTGWDQASKEFLWKEPELIDIIHQQRESGIYDRIATEINRQRTLGILPANVPFIQAYKTVGDELVKAGSFADLIPTTETKPVPQAPVKEPIETRVAKPKPTVANNDKASSASPTRAASTKANSSVNPLAMSDDDFLRQFNGRL